VKSAIPDATSLNRPLSSDEDSSELGDFIEDEQESGSASEVVRELVDTDDEGLYHCAACGNALFDSRAKYHSGTGWPSFTETVTPDAVELVENRSHGMIRTEVRCACCHSHLGHLFDDGPREAGGPRWCMNSVALDLRRG
jgi:peptide-methionine (R)-S-oxide reductase